MLRTKRSLFEPGQSENAEPRIRINNKAMPDENETARNGTSAESIRHSPTYTAPADSYGQRTTGKPPSGTIAAEVIKYIASAAAKGMAAQSPPLKTLSVDELTGKYFKRVRTGVFTFKLKSTVTKPEPPPGLKPADVELLLRKFSKKGFIRTPDSRDGLPTYTFK